MSISWLILWKRAFIRLWGLIAGPQLTFFADYATNWLGYLTDWLIIII
jgi:hypothetical protein